MLIAIFSDLHDNLNNWHLFIKKINQLNIKILLFLGDLTSNETLKIIGNDFKHTIYLVSGNADLYNNNTLKKYPHLKHLGESNIITIDNLNIGLSHFPKLAKELIYKNKKKLDFVFYGHSHKPYLEIINNTYLVNPGNLNDLISPTFVLLNTNNKHIKLKRI